MYYIYSLKKHLEDYPEEVILVQKMTLNDKKPFLGMKGKYGLYGSNEWWGNMNNKTIPQKMIQGIITKVYTTGWEEFKKNTIDIMLNDKSIIVEGMYCNNNDINMYKVGKKIEIYYFSEEQKMKRDNGKNIILDYILDVYIER
ncbi:hypothetical protein [Acinetobacter pollinis]|uniref:Uncharacterized protein n=1 Tax=Acinetobacter pollinis TaxID=2605270 RepID=A0ABU6DVU6_9GAMM|nr:hypothetical protein [Acinetobacter pollinis]MEB5477518.1 hypothetical protein [Acinetobacter pollinis]